MRPCFQLWTEGNAVEGWQFKAKSKAIFLSREGAERHVSEFEERCYDQERIGCAERGSLKTEIVQLELHD